MSDPPMSDSPVPFTDEELTAAETVPLTDEILYHALRIGTQALSEFGHVVMEPVFRGQLALTDRENAIGMTFYRLLAAVHTLSDLRQPSGDQRADSSHLRAVCRYPPAGEKEDRG